MSDAHSVTQLLEQWNHGDREALDKLMPLIYEELRKMAKRYMSQLIAFDEALKELESLSTRQARVVELRYFGGLTVDETAIVLKVSHETVMRDWTIAKTW